MVQFFLNTLYNYTKIRSCSSTIIPSFFLQCSCGPMLTEKYFTLELIPITSLNHLIMTTAV